MAVAIAAGGRTFIADERMGTIFKLSKTLAAPNVLLTTLIRPSGLLLEDPGHLLLVADGFKSAPGRNASRGPLLRVDIPTRAVAVLVDGLKKPRGLAKGHDGSIYPSTDGLRGPDESDDAVGQEFDSDAEDKEDDAKDSAHPASLGTIFW